MDNGENNRPGGNKPGGNNSNGRMVLICLAISLGILCVIQFAGNAIRNGNKQEITYDQFLRMVDEGNVEEVVIKSTTLEITPRKQSSFNGRVFVTGIIEDDNLEEKLYAAGVTFYKDLNDTGTSILSYILSLVLPLLLMFGLLFLFMRTMSKNGGGVMGIGRSNAKLYDIQKETGVTFKDVAGEDEAIESIKEMVDFLHNPGKYQKIGAKLPKGALLVGPPGTGKTLLAKAVAGEAKVPFFSLSGSSFVEMFVGVGASRVRDLFKQAQAQAPCIVFIDELDAIGKSRDNQYNSNDEREQTLNQLLAEMDGFDSSKGVVIFAATNRPEVLDKALLRPGRFDRRIIVDRPDLKGRLAVLKVHARNVLLDETVDLDAIAQLTSGAAGSDLANMINEAAILAVKNGRTAVSQADLMESVEVVVAGKEKKDRIMGPEERRRVAYHETGHALMTALQKHTEPVRKITIIPRMKGSLGYVLQAPEEEKFLQSEDELKAEIAMCYGGMAAERLVFGNVSNGASSDIEHASAIARNMVTIYGMSENLGPVGLASIENRYLDGRAVMNCGEKTYGEIDHEVMDIVRKGYDTAYELLSQNRETLDKIAEYLLEKETITGQEFMEIFNRVQGTGSAEAQTETADTGAAVNTAAVGSEQGEKSE